ncbi:hypothetical protein HZS_7934 [Henneguya salminicola]|nr:hypothetical protein HZS_7934 [Henneguya salminicola]
MGDIIRILLFMPYFLLPYIPFRSVIIMCFDSSKNVYVPTVYTLLMSNNENMQCSLFYEIIVLLQCSFMPRFITCDFEYVLLNAIKQEFTETLLIGGYFHKTKEIWYPMKTPKKKNTEK